MAGNAPIAHACSIELRRIPRQVINTMNTLKDEPHSPPLQVLMVDDSQEFLSAAQRLIAYQPGIKVVGTATSASEAIQLAQELSPHLVLMDIVMPDINGIDVTRRIKRQSNAPRVVMLTLHDNAEYRFHAQLAGADGFIAKSELETALPHLIERMFTAPATVQVQSPADMPARQEAASRALSENDERLRHTLEAGDMGVFDWDVETGAITWTQEHARLFGLNLSQFNGTYDGFTRCVHPADVSGVEQAVEEARRTRQNFKHKYRVIWPDGSVHWIFGRGRFIYNAEGHAVHMTGVVMDITESMLALLELRENQARLSAIFNAGPQCIKLVDENGIIRDINRAGAALLGAENPEDVIGKPVTDFIATEHHETTLAFHKSVLRGNRGTLVFEMVCRDGRRRWVESHSVPHTSAQNSGASALSVTLDVTERVRDSERLSFLAQHDALTGLPNRLLFTDRLRQAMIEAQRHNRLVGVVFLDLDRFKNINDTLGHDVGDAMLVEVAARLRDAVRPSDTIARLGGDEFAVILADMARAEDAPMVVQRILDAFKEPFQIDGRELFISASLGITLYPIDETDVDALLRDADTAMYRAKQHGRSTCQFYTAEMTLRAHEDMALEGALRHAIEHDELLLHYQPIIDLNTGHILGVEALLRWQHPELGLVPPARFIPLAEESGLIVPIGEWVLHQACQQTHAWHNAGFTDLYVAVNLSSRQFREPDLVARVKQVLADTGLSGIRLELELTESMLLTNIDNTVRQMQELDTAGVRFVIDDFGTGYSSLSYLKRFPIDVLKIDQSFVRDITTDPDDAAIVRAIITMAHALGVRVVAEGVETHEQMEFLRANRCDSMQGYYLSKPLPAEALTALLAEGLHLLPQAPRVREKRV
jgi:diguanylate cyclase (GGDEF)-like protein/PAS domain S-box-containing protein